MGADSAESDGNWFRRRRQRAVDRAAQRVHDSLLADPDSFRRPPSTTALTLLSALIVLGLLALAAGLVLAWTHADGTLARILVLVGAAVWLWLAWPAPVRYYTDIAWAAPGSLPGVESVVATLADRIGVTPPELVGVDLEFNMAVGRRQRLGRGSVLVIGLPLWCALDRDQRLGVIAHELGHLRNDDLGGRFWLQRYAGGVIDKVVQTLTPETAATDDHGDLQAVGDWLLRLLAAPFQAVLLLLNRLAGARSQHAEYLSDRRAAAVMGSEALVSGLALDAEGLRTTATAAALRGEDPLAHLRERTRVGLADAHRRRTPRAGQTHRADDTHPPDHLRINLLLAQPRPPGEPIAAQHLDRAEAEIGELCDELSRRYRDALINPAY